MNLNIYTVKWDINYQKQTSKTYTYYDFDTAEEFQDLDFEEKFNRAAQSLEDEINDDRLNNDATKYNAIEIRDIYIS